MAHFVAGAPQLPPISPALSSPALCPPTLSSRPPPASASPPPATPSLAGGAQPPQPPQHKRVYQACIPCRRRKVRCDLGSVDNPHEPPCVRCRRESKHCYFSSTRRKRKADDGSLVDDLDAEPDSTYVARNGRKQARTDDVASPTGGRDSTDGQSNVGGSDGRGYDDVPRTPGGSRGRSQPLKRPGDAFPSAGSGPGPGPGSGSGARSAKELGGGEPNTPLENLEARSVMRRELYGPHDALDLLYKAATDKSVQVHGDGRLLLMGQAPPFDAGPPPEPGLPQARRQRNGSLHEPAAPRPGLPAKHAIDPELTKQDHAAPPGLQEALNAWNRFRFVRAGWFTAQEAINYIEYYYDYLSPLTPISAPTFRHPATHLTLLTEEPILTVTLLTIASRYHPIQGPGGHCRSHAVHEQLWTYLRGMIERVVWGQEAFGGGFCGSGADETQNSSTAPWRGLRRGSLRTLGTIESLMILTEWHPRALHFPPSEAIDELLLPSYEASNSAAADENHGPPAGFGGMRIESWLEPAWRSDRMCWMLLSIGMGLAYELGVFDDIDELLAAGAIARPEYEDEPYRLRASRIRRLLLIYLSQLAGRLGWTSMVPETLRKDDMALWRRRPQSVEGATPATNPSCLSNSFKYIPDLELDDQIIHCWAGISNAMHIANEKLFKSRKHTTDIIQSGAYTDLLKDFQPMLKDWWLHFERLRMPPFIRQILSIEFEYVRIYINSLSLQAVVERSANNSGTDPQQLSPHTQNFLSKVPLASLGGFGAQDREYVKEVVNGSRNLLKTVVEGLLPGDYLKHAPVRTYFRIISGAMFLLKTFALGAPKSDVELSIGLMDRTVDALRNCVVDDVHLGIRFADMLETLTSRLRNRFIHAPPPPSSFVDRRSPVGNFASGANGHGHASDPWPKPRDGLHGPERSTTPANISATSWDINIGSFPYPSGSASVFGPTTLAAVSGMSDGLSTTNLSGANNFNSGGLGANNSGSSVDNGLFDSSDWNAPGVEMWYLPAGSFFQNTENSTVAMTAEGVNVGGLDLLEYMAMDPMDGDFGMDDNAFS